MSKYIKYLFVLLVTVQFSCAKAGHEEPAKDVAIIPQPESITENGEIFIFSSKTVIQLDTANGQLIKLANYFNEKLANASGWELGVEPSGSEIANSIKMQLDAGLDNLGAEGYQLKVDAQNITLSASQPAGLFYALQSVIQLFPDAFHVKGGMADWKSFEVAGVEISDKPRFGWRGYMLDVSRHFFGKEDIKKALDMMAELKLNRFHWHLTDDQGWRIEIKKYPKLTEVGAWRVDHNNTDESIIQWWGRKPQQEGEKATYGGFYTQEDIKEIVAYAKERHIEVLPEIDMPGHSQATIASYPEYGCVNAAPYVATGGVASNNTMNPGKEETFEFVEDVLNEVMDLFPFNYVHIGGDECNKSQWAVDPDAQRRIKEEGLKDERELQSYFIKRLEKMVNARGKNMIGWNEILEGGLAPNATVMSWQGEHGGIVAAKAGHDVIMTPMNYVYLDLRQGQADYEPNLGYSEALLSACYNYSVIPEGFTEEQASKILGLQGNLWGEPISDWSKLTYMSYPRLFAVAENGWTDESNQNFEDFIDRLQVRLKKLDATGVRYAKSAFNPWIRPKGNGETIEFTLESELGHEIRYTLDGTEPDSTSTLYTKPFTLSETKVLKTATFENGQRLGDVIEDTFPVHKAAGAKVINLQARKGKATTPREVALTDLNYGEMEAPGDQDWMHYRNDLDVEIVLDAPTDIESVVVSALGLTIFGNYAPVNVEVYGATETGDFEKIGDSGHLEDHINQGRRKLKTTVDCPAKNISRIRVKATALNPIPDWHNRPGGKANLMIDEILIL